MNLSNIRKEQLIFHYHSVYAVDENEIYVEKDPLVIYRAKNEQVQVKIRPLRSSVVDQYKNFAFKDKVEIFSRKLSDLKTGKSKELLDSNDEVVTIKYLTEFGIYEDFIEGYNNPHDLGMTFDEYFDSTFYDLEIGLDIYFNAGFESALQ